MRTIRTMGSPMDLSKLPRVRLAHLPTPLEPMVALADRIGAAPRLFVKRDDCTGLALGGNKTRKLEYTLGDALERGADVLVTCGGLQSNHVRQTAAAAAKFGLECHAVVTNPLTGTGYDLSAVYGETGNLLLDNVLGCHMHQVSDGGAATEARTGELVAELQAAGRTPYVVPLGASDGVGAMGYAGCALELLEQCTALGIDPSHIVLGTGSAGTQAGLLAGLRAAGSGIEVLGIAVSETAEAKLARTRAVLDQMEALWPGDAPAIRDEDIVVNDGFVGDGYALPSAAGTAAIRIAAETEGLLLDPVYTSKVMAALLALLDDGPLATGRDVIFLHTGGSPALFAYPELFRSREVAE